VDFHCEEQAEVETEDLLMPDRTRTRTRTNTNPNDTEANAAGRSENARALRKQSKCGVYHEGEGHWPKFSQKLQKAGHLWVARTPQKQ